MKKKLFLLPVLALLLGACSPTTSQDPTTGSVTLDPTTSDIPSESVPELSPIEKVLASVAKEVGVKGNLTIDFFYDEELTELAQHDEATLATYVNANKGSEEFFNYENGTTYTNEKAWYVADEEGYLMESYYIPTNEIVTEYYYDELGQKVFFADYYSALDFLQDDTVTLEFVDESTIEVAFEEGSDASVLFSDVLTLYPVELTGATLTVKEDGSLGTVSFIHNETQSYGEGFVYLVLSFEGTFVERDEIEYFPQIVESSLSDKQASELQAAFDLINLGNYTLDGLDICLVEDEEGNLTTDYVYFDQTIKLSNEAIEYIAEDSTAILYEQPDGLYEVSADESTNPVSLKATTVEPLYPETSIKDITPVVLFSTDLFTYDAEKSVYNVNLSLEYIDLLIPLSRFYDVGSIVPLNGVDIELTYEGSSLVSVCFTSLYDYYGSLSFISCKLYNFGTTEFSYPDAKFVPFVAPTSWEEFDSELHAAVLVFLPNFDEILPFVFEDTLNLQVYGDPDNYVVLSFNFTTSSKLSSFVDLLIDTYTTAGWNFEELTDEYGDTYYVGAHSSVKYTLTVSPFDMSSWGYDGGTLDVYLEPNA